MYFEVRFDSPLFKLKKKVKLSFSFLSLSHSYKFPHLVQKDILQSSFLFYYKNTSRVPWLPSG